MLSVAAKVSVGMFTTAMNNRSMWELEARRNQKAPVHQGLSYGLAFASTNRQRLDKTTKSGNTREIMASIQKI